jgi:hypothetical protein
MGRRLVTTGVGRARLEGEGGHRTITERVED